MSEHNGTGIQYPTIELGGTTYTIKFSRGSQYRMQKMGVTFTPKLKQLADGQVQRSMSFSEVVDMLHIGINFKGTPEELAEIVDQPKLQEAFDKIWEAWGKAFPPAQIRLQEPAGSSPEAPPVQ